MFAMSTKGSPVHGDPPLANGPFQKSAVKFMNHPRWNRFRAIGRYSFLWGPTCVSSATSRRERTRAEVLTGRWRDLCQLQDGLHEAIQIAPGSIRRHAFRKIRRRKIDARRHHEGAEPRQHVAKVPIDAEIVMGA